ncbi:hypothetical protein ABK040_006041 [Willaertia magna]
MKYTSQKDYQRQLQLWNEDLEKHNFSLEPFLQQCKREQEQIKDANDLLIKLLQQKLINNSDLSPSQSSSYSCDFQTLHTTSFYAKMSFNKEQENMADLLQQPFRSLANKMVEKQKSNRKSKRCSKKIIIHIEHPELPKEKKKKGRPFKIQDEDNGPKQIVFVPNCYNKFL